VGLALHPLATLAVLGVYVVILVIFRISSVASLIAAACFPLMVIVLFNNEYQSLGIFSVLVAFLIVLTHRANIRRMIKGEEKKFRWRREADSF
jgi:glycerol-3-phosphate acyltransferase PlsY